MIVAEGVMMYLTEDIVKPLLNRLTDHFPGGQVAFDSLSRIGARMAKLDRAVSATGATFGWGIDDPNDIKAFAPKMELVIESHTPDLPGYAKLPWVYRAVVRSMEPFTPLRRLNRLLLYRF
jgi:O-methyltransferase involved in polyketide biosynthesis